MKVSHLHSSCQRLTAHVDQGSVMTHQPVHHPRLTSESEPVGEPHDATGVTP